MIIRGVEIGKASPKICIPIVGKTYDEIMLFIDDLDCFDLLEIRLDYFDDIGNDKCVYRLLEDIRAKVDCPLILTIRTSCDGGCVDMSYERYSDLLLACCRYVDIVDVQISMGRMEVYTLTSKLHQEGVKVLLSHHDFNKTLALNEIIDVFEQMELLGADLLKVAYMPRSKRDVICVMDAMMLMSDRIHKPLIGISMGSLGKITRICGELIGSAITFASGMKESAPGQMSASELKGLLEAIHD